MRRLVVGVDGAPDGWVSIALEVASRDVVDASSHARFADLITTYPDAVAIAVDMPIGLPTHDDWPRGPDRAAQARLGRMRSSVFLVPPMEALLAATHAEAVAICRSAGVPGVSQQAYALRAKIFEVAEATSDRRVREVHPEVSFAEMNGGPLNYGKRTWSGFLERRGLLEAAGIRLPDDLVIAGRARVDDVLDAAAAAWTASRIATGLAHWLPPDAGQDEPRIWY